MVGAIIRIAIAAAATRVAASVACWGLVTVRLGLIRGIQPIALVTLRSGTGLGAGLGACRLQHRLLIQRNSEGALRVLGGTCAVIVLHEVHNSGHSESSKPSERERVCVCVCMCV